MPRNALLAIVLLGACNVDAPVIPQDPVPPAPTEAYIPMELREKPLAAAPVENIQLDDNLELRPAIKDGRMALVPIVMTGTPKQEFTTLVAGMKQGLVTVREMPGEFEVDSVKVTNRSHQPLFLASGELITEAHQDRAIFADTVVEPGKTETVHVRCVELDRDYGGKNFTAGNAIVEIGLRQTIVLDSQSKVWQEVDKINAKKGITAPTKSYRHAAAKLATQVNPRRDHLTAELAMLPYRDQMVGFAIAVDGKVVSVEHFASPNLYRALEPSLLASYSDRDDGEPVLESGRVTAESIRMLEARPSNTTAASTVSFIKPSEL